MSSGPTSLHKASWFRVQSISYPRERIKRFGGRISGGEYDIILLHFSLHDFPKEYRPDIVGQLAENLKPAGRLRIREPLGGSHGIRLHEIINLLEHTKKLDFEYKIVNSVFLGTYADIAATRKA